MENNVGKRILEVRTKRDYTQEELAEKIGIGYKHLSNIERGLAKPSVLTVIKILNIFHLSLEECLNEYSKNEINPKELKIKEILQYIDLIEPDKNEKKFLIAMAHIVNKRTD